VFWVGADLIAHLYEIQTRDPQRFKTCQYLAQPLHGD